MTISTVISKKIRGSQKGKWNGIRKQARIRGEQRMKDDVKERDRDTDRIEGYLSKFNNNVVIVTVHDLSEVFRRMSPLAFTKES